MQFSILLYVLAQLAVSVPLKASEQPLTVSISRRKHHGMTRLDRAKLGKKHTLNKYHLHFAKSKKSPPKTSRNHTTSTRSHTSPTHAATSGAVAEGPTPGSGSVALTNIRNELFSAPVVIGKGQTFLMDLDTGSSDTWVRGAECVAGKSDIEAKLDSCKGSKLDITDSTLSATTSTYATQYGSGSVSGTIYKGPVSIGGLAATIPIGVSKTEEGFDDGGASDGLLGLGFDSISTISSELKQSASFIDGLGLTGTRNMFAFYFSNYNDHDKGEVTVGGYDKSKIAGPITWLPLSDKSYWQFDWQGAKFSVNGKSLTAVDSSKSAIADTGTTLIVVDDKVAESINTAIGAKLDEAQGVYIIDCKTSKSLPSIDFTFGGATYSIPASVYTFVDADSGTCFSGISGGAAQLGSVILGDIFLRQYYSIYDKDQARVGFALAKHP